MKKMWIIALLLVLFAVTGCSQIAVNTGPRNVNEMFPDRHVSETSVLAIFTGQPAFVAEFYDQATGQMAGQWAEAGASPIVTYNGERPVRRKEKELSYGEYRVVVKPFYYVSYFLPFIRKRVDLPEQEFYLNLRPGKQKIYNEETKRYWADVLRIDTGWIPREHYQSPTVDIQGTEFMAQIVNDMRQKGVIR